MEDLYARQQTPEPDHSKDVCIVGCGGVGSWTSIHLAMGGVCRSLYLIDYDSIERSNLNRLPYTEDDIGKPKVEVLRSFIKARRPNLPVVAYNHKLTSDDNSLIDVHLDYVVMAADGMQAHQATRACFPDLIDNRRVLFIGAEGTELSLRRKTIGWHPNDGEDFQYEDVWMGTVSCAGRMAAWAITKGFHDNHYFENDVANLDMDLLRLNHQMKQKTQELEMCESERERLSEKYRALVKENHPRHIGDLQALVATLYNKLEETPEDQPQLEGVVIDE